ncbi:iron export ABC transporter permease subunit FetB [Kineobactrum sediminis]|uniref:Iron export ABC transporter permease subunit FetB n=1 Tax=Kineobactrum sediminis TaxID=1905677 RepID=A0A2N5Y7C6_9GAMM|nr:iron export ABC transporter permease subunit FetB [Kineobactrum sediminis]PLW84286.1 iron export ABC transporter permease subunit FetB [Kineobactrum sediminis]
MDSAYIQIGNLELALAALLMLINLGLSAWLRLGLGRQLVLASVRMSVQLLLVGLILEWIFALRNPWVVLLLAMIMGTTAGIAAVGRTGRRFPGIYRNSLLNVLFASFLVTGLAGQGIIRFQPWYDPQYFIPLLGMLLGNALTGISLALDRFMENLVSRRAFIESMLCLGATRWEAAHREVKDAVRTGMIPIINAMMVMGVVSLPGMMTGQILAGADPADAVRYQIVIVFMIAASTALGTLGVVMMSFFSMFSSRHRLLSAQLLRTQSE